MNIMEIINNIGNKVKFIWIPGHSGITCNDEVDALAKAATNSDHIEYEVGLELREAYGMATDYCIKRWQESWNTSATGRHHHSIQPVVSGNMKTGQKRSRLHEVVLTRLRLGKCRLNHYMKKFKFHPSGECDTCQVQENIEHYLLQCRTSPVRAELERYCLQHSLQFNLPTVLNNNYTQDIICKNIDRNI
jgi:hypothetical protein